MLGDRTLVFFHIPKTAGSTLAATLGSLTPDDAQFLTGHHNRTHFEDAMWFAGLTEDQKRRYHFVAGHLEMPTVENLPSPKFVFTFLRSPVARCVSLYNFVRRTPSHHMHGVLASGMGIAEFMNKARWDEVHNGMTRRLAGIINQPIPAYDPAILKRAMFNLAARFDFVGLQESFDKSLLVLGRMLGLGTDQLAYTSVNVTPGKNGREKLDKWTLECLLEHNRMDLELYEFGCQRFKELVRAQGPKLDRELKAFKKQLKQQGEKGRALGQAA
jgi:hypothetical protein